MTDKQQHLYLLYKEVDELCRKHNIDYQLAGGTLIGAIRHRGFIPWDDDMDITMTRKKFVRLNYLTTEFLSVRNLTTTSTMLLPDTQTELHQQYTQHRYFLMM